MQELGGLFNDVIVLGIFIYFALLLHGKAKSSNKRIIDKIERYKEKKISFIVVWGGISIFSLLIIESII